MGRRNDLWIDALICRISTDQLAHHRGRIAIPRGYEVGVRVSRHLAGLAYRHQPAGELVQPQSAE